jgi:hypothetical protein
LTWVLWCLALEKDVYGRETYMTRTHPQSYLTILISPIYRTPP